MSLFLLRLTIGFYSIGLLHAFLTIITRKKILFRMVLASIVIGFFCHAFAIGLAWSESQHPPISTLQDVFSFFALVIVLAFLLSYARYRLYSLSVFVFPLAFILTLLANLISSPSQPYPEILRSLWLYIHVPTIFLGYSAFFVAFASGLMYLIQENELKRKRPQAFYYRLPSLEVCDELGYRSLSIGFPLLTIGLVAGTFWQLPLKLDPKIVASFITWLTYGILITYRLSANLRGKKAALMAVLGFIFVMVTFFGTRSQGSAHSFIQ